MTSGVSSVNTFTGAVQSVIVAGTAVASTSGTSIDFTGIPSWVKRITVMCNGVSLSGSSAFLVQLGTASGVETTGYDAVLIIGSQASSNTVNASTAGFPFYSGAASYIVSGSIIFNNVSGNIWVAQGVFANSTTTAYVTSCAGTKTLASILTRVRVTTTNGTDTFDAGSINILYE